MNCPQCATENPEGAKFCLNCGTRLAVACPQCGAALPAQAKFCTECGSPVGAPPKGTQPPELDAMAVRLQRLVPKEYAARLLASRGQVGHERRTVTILFSDIKGSTAMAEGLDPEEVLEIMDGAFDVLIEPVYRHEGTLARLMGDAVLAFFGAPIAHEDDAERAIRAALDIISGAQEYAARLERERGIKGFNVRVGIHTGLVVVGEVGSDLRVEYTAMGDAVNLAARMEQHASPGGILITHDTYSHVRGVFDVLAQEPLAVKGKAEQVQTYMVQRAKPRAFRKPVRGVEGIETRMVGREAELKHLQEAFHAAFEDSELQFVTISGEAGVGKSRLLYEFDTWSELLPERFYYFKARAFPEMQRVPYGLLRNLVAFRFQIQDSDPAGLVREKLEARVRLALGDEADSQAAAHLIGHLLGFEMGESTHLEAIQDDALAVRDQALGHLAGYFRGMTTQLPVLVLLEDLHWADDSSLDALNHLALALGDRPVMVVAATRPALFERRPHWGEGQPFHSRLEVQPLSKWDSRQLVAEILQKVREVPQALRDLIVTGAEGNPFFVEELIKMLIEDGVIAKGADAWHIARDRLAGVRVPPTLTGVLQARVDRLPLEERTVLQQASVVGRLFWDRAVARINESVVEEPAPTGILDTLATLWAREMVFQRETSAFAGTQEYLFKHALLREVAYESVLKRVRRVYHGLVADWLLEQAGERVEEYTGLIAEHLALAGRTAEAVKYLLQAGDRARALYAHQEAIHAYEGALALLKEMGEDEQAARTLMQLGLVHHTAFDFRRARQAYEEGFALWQRASERRPEGPPPRAPHALRRAWIDPLTLDPTLVPDRPSNAITQQLFAGLALHTPELGIVPDVAKSWDVSDGGRRYTFHLRDGVVWSDGTPVTAHDFECAWKRVLDPASASKSASLLYDVKGAEAFHQGMIADADAVGVRATDDATLEVELAQPAGYFLHLLADIATFPVPRHVVEQHGDAWAEPGHIVTNGPFTLASWQRGESMVLVRYPHYHGPVGGNVQQVALSLFDEPGSQGIQMYEAGSLDVAEVGLVAMDEYNRIRSEYPDEHVTRPAAGTFYLAFPVGQAPFDDLRLRRALAQATDREALLDVLQGRGSPALGGFVPPGIPGHLPDIALPYSPERARQLLAEAGYPGGVGFPAVEWLTWYGAQTLAENLQAQWRETLGLETRWRAMDWAEFYDLLETGLAAPFLLIWLADLPDPDNYLRIALSGRLPSWGRETYFALVEEARQAMDQTERMALYAQAERILAEEVPILPLAYDRWPMLLKPWVKRFPTAATYQEFWKDVVLEPH